MKSLWKSILDGLTYKDLAGRKQPRAYTVLTGLILLLLVTAAGMVGLNRYLLMSKVQVTPESVSLIPPIAEATATNAAVHRTPWDGEVTGCPTDSAAWSFTPTYASRNYGIIQPACVYMGLEKNNCLGAGGTRRMATSPGDHIMVNTNSPPCTPRVPARRIGIYESELNKRVKARKRAIFFCGDIICSLILLFDV